MKTAIKLALIGATLVTGAANAANVNTGSNTATGSSLILLMKNYSDNEFFFAELSPTVNDVKTFASLVADGPNAYSLDAPTIAAGPLNVPAALNGYTSTNLSAYLTASSHVGDNIVWSIMGSRTGDGTAELGQGEMVFTSSIDHLANYWTTDLVYTAAGAMGSFIVNEINGPGVTFPGGVSATNGWDSASPFGKFADVTFNGGGFENGAAVGTAQSLYVVATGGDEGFAANVYKSAYTLTLSSAGVLTYNAPVSSVPIPAAVWLLGSSLMGLLGVGRRRKGATVVAA
jgi:hypothetical protein